jgi:hypothetical protein
VSTTLVPAVIDWLVSAAAASPLLGAANPPVVVLDGPDVSPDVLAQPRLLWVGASGPHDPAVEAAAAQSDWPILDAARTTDEDVEITCAAEYWSGSAAMKVNRDGCAAIVDAFASLLRGTPQAGGPGDTTMGGLVFWSRVSPVSWQQEQRSDGSAALCQFKVMYRGRVTT